jgi:hypothetical protein
LGLDEDALLERLGAAAAALEDRFAVGGCLSIPAGIVIHARKDGATCDLKLPSALEPANAPKGDTPLDRLLKVCDPSGFGDGNQTRYDPNVRRASHVPAERLEIEGFSLEESGILEEIQASLAPDADRIHAKLLKLNVYPEGGHFATHRDTPPTPPPGQIHLGSLVVVLPTAHVGGNLSVKHRGEDKVYVFDGALVPERDWRTPQPEGAYELKLVNYFISVSSDLEKRQQEHIAKIKAGITRPVLPWAAFYGDCEHTVAKVETGTRLSLAYQLFIDGTSPPPAAAADSSLAATEATSPAPSSSDVTAAVREWLMHQTLPELKQFCCIFKKPVTGTKMVLLERLFTVPADQILARLTRPTQQQILNPGSQKVVRYLPTDSCFKRAQRFANILRSTLKQPDFLPYGGDVGFPCFHLYECEADLPRVPLAPGVKASQIHLKGADAIIAIVAARMGLSVRFLRICHFIDGGDGCWKITEELISHKNVAKLTTDVCIEDEFMAKGVDIEDAETGTDLFDGINWAIGFSLNNGQSAPGAKDLSHDERPPIGMVLDDIWMSGTGYFGNEASSGSIYSNVAIVIEIPEAESEFRKRDLTCPLSVDSFNKTRAGSDPRYEEEQFRDRASKVRLPAVKQKKKKASAKRRGGMMWIGPMLFMSPHDLSDY